MIAEAVRSLAAGGELPPAAVEGAVQEILAGEADPIQVAALLMGLRMAGETAAQIAAAARVMRGHALSVQVSTPGPVLDTCGTGGDGHDTFNISTLAAVVIAACDVTVAKHGNRAASSRCGSADLLEALGVPLDMPPERVGSCIDEVGIGFMFARTHHPAMRHVGQVRAALGIRTLFNFLGPVTNPAGATHQLLGVGDPQRQHLLADVLRELQVERAWVVCGDQGMDEVALSGPTQVIELDRGQRTEWTLTPEDFGVERAPVTALQGGDAARNRELALDILAGGAGPIRDAVVVNAAAGLCVAGRAPSPLAGAQLATEALATGRARERLERWIRYGRGNG